MDSLSVLKAIATLLQRTLVVKFTINDNLTERMHNRSWRRDVIDILEIMRRHYPGKHVTISGTFAMVDPCR